MRDTAVERLPNRLAVSLTAILTLLATLLAPALAASPDWPVWIAPANAPLPAIARVVGSLPVADALLVASPVAPPGAARADTPLSWKQLLGPAPVGGSDEPVVLDSGVATTGAPVAWETTRGAGAVVALVDTGVAPVPVLDGAVAGEIDFSGTGGGDGYGHGTFLASLVAGRGPDVSGVAPEALVLSLKVAGPDGSTDLGRVLGALQWLFGPGQASGVRIAVLALGLDPDSEGGALIDRATAALARQGVLVVTAAGNDGPGELTAPATAGGTFSVGALDDQGDADRSNDVVASFSATGLDRYGVLQPDAHAPGVNIVGSIPPDSLIARTYPEATIDGGWFRGSGTSMATALAAGVAALVSSARPDLDGADIDAALRAGDGAVDAAGAVAQALSAPSTPGGGPGAGTPATPGSRGRSAGRGPAGQAEPQGVRWVERDPWDGVRWVHEWNGVRWAGVRWVGVRWAGVRWVDDHWADEAWDAGQWGGVRWVGNGWAGDAYAADVHSGVRWAGVRWAGVRWALVSPRT